MSDVVDGGLRLARIWFRVREPLVLVALILFIVAQRHIVEGIARRGSKG